MLARTAGIHSQSSSNFKVQPSRRQVIKYSIDLHVIHSLVYCSQSNNSIRCALVGDGGDGLAMLACLALGGVRSQPAWVSRLKVIKSTRNNGVGGLTGA